MGTLFGNNAVSSAGINAVWVCRFVLNRAALNRLVLAGMHVLVATMGGYILHL